MDAPGPGGGLGASLSRLLGTALEVGQNRLELLGTEYQLEKLRVFDALLQAALGLMCVGIGLVLLSGLLLLMLQDAHRLPVLAVMVLAWGAAGAWLIAAARQRLHGSTPLFSASATELERDRAALPPGE